jgi:hypothetical protein
VTTLPGGEAQHSPLTYPPCLPLLNPLTGWMNWLQVNAASIFFWLFGHLSNMINAAACCSKTKAMQDAPWRLDKPKAFSKPKKVAVASKATTHLKKKCKVSSSQGWSYIWLSFLRTLTCPSKPTVAHGQDAPDRPRHSAQSGETDKDNFSDMPPHFACRKHVHNLTDDRSVMSQSNGSETQDSQDYKSNQDEEDLHNLNGSELALTFNNEVSLFILMQCEVIQLFLGCSMGPATFAIFPTPSP